MKNLIITLSLFITTLYLTAQAPSIEWQKSLGGAQDDYAFSIQQTLDGGYIVAGDSRSDNGDVTGHYYWSDYWVVKLDSLGIIEWQKSLGGNYDDFANSIQQTTDGGYVVAGSSQSTNGDVTGNHGDFDYWVVKLTSTGAMDWQKSLGGTGNDQAFSIQQTTDGGYIVAGRSSSTNGDVTGNHGISDYWVVKLDSTSTIVWQKCLGSSYNDYASSIQQTTDGGYIVAGGSDYSDGDVTGNHGYYDYWVVKLDSIGTIAWQKSLGGTGRDLASFIQQTTDGGYVVAGESDSHDGDVTSYHGGKEYWVVKLNSMGTIEWQKCLGGTGGDYAKSIQQTTDGSYVIAGFSNSTDGDVTGNHFGYDYWVVKLSLTVGVNEMTELNEFSVYPNPTSNQITLKANLN
ncbi:MAG: T9SS C-terminal target domain-containing protein [Flavobacteriales bacterium]